MKCFKCNKPATHICTCLNQSMCRNHRIDHLQLNHQHSIRNIASDVPEVKQNHFKEAIVHELQHFEKIERILCEINVSREIELHNKLVGNIHLVKSSLRQMHDSVSEYSESIIDRYLMRNRSHPDIKTDNNNIIDFYSQDFGEKSFLSQQKKEFLNNHSTCNYSLALSRDNNYVFTGCEDNTVRMWDLNLKTLVHMFLGHFDRIYALAITTDERFLISGSNDKTIKVWDLNTKRLHHEFLGHKLGVKCIATINDLIVSGSYGKTIKIWSIQTLNELFTLNLESGDIHCLKILNNNMTLLSGTTSKNIHIWNLHSGELIEILPTEKGVLSCIVSNDERFIFTGHTEGEIIKWSYLNKAKLKRFEIQLGRRISFLAISKDDQTLFSVEFEDPLKFYNVITIWNTNGNKLGQLIGHAQWIYGLIVTNDDRHLISASMDCTIKVWLIEERREVSILKNTPINYLSLVFSHNGQYAVYGSGIYVVLYDILCYKMKYFTGHICEVRGIAYSSDNNLIVSGSYDEYIKVWFIDHPEKNYTFTKQDSPIYSLIITKDNNSVLSGLHNGSIKVWDLNLKNLQFELPLENNNIVICLSQSSVDEKLIACAFDNGFAQVWNLEQNSCVYKFKFHEVRIKSIVFSNDGKAILTSDISGKKVLKYIESINNEITIEDESELYRNYIEFLSKFNKFINER